jgi:hypothetical protein
MHCTSEFFLISNYSDIYIKIINNGILNSCNYCCYSLFFTQPLWYNGKTADFSLEGHEFQSEKKSYLICRQVFMAVVMALTVNFIFHLMLKLKHIYSKTYSGKFPYIQS